MHRHSRKVDECYLKSLELLFFWYVYNISGLPRWLSSKESDCNAGDVGSIPGLGRSLGGGHGNPFQYSFFFFTPVFLPGESPWTEEPGGLQSIGSQSVGYN